jgi:hypothetical protein
LAAYGIECELAIELMDEIEALYFNDTITMGVIEENRNVCSSFINPTPPP